LEIGVPRRVGAARALVHDGDGEREAPAELGGLDCPRGAGGARGEARSARDGRDQVALAERRDGTHVDAEGIGGVEAERVAADDAVRAHPPLEGAEAAAVGARMANGVRWGRVEE